LRKSLTKQLVAAYIAFTGKEKKLSLLGKTFAVGVGTSYAEPMIAQLINEQTLIDPARQRRGGRGKDSGGPCSVLQVLAAERLADLVVLRIRSRRLLRLSAAR